MSDATYPVEAIRPALMDAMDRAPVVITAPTGSGKSTMVPRWCMAAGRVMVIEPRRVACQALAARVAELEGEPLGQRVGFRVRDAAAVSAATRLAFVTPGIALRRMDEVVDHEVVIVDELHERAMEVDLLLALLRARHPGRLVVMSATLEADRVAAYLEGRHLQAEGRMFPVEIEHLCDPGQLLPEVKGIERRVLRALEATARGDTLVFLPGKGEIAAVASALSGRHDLDVLPLHGGLSLAEQGRVFRPAERRKVVLSTNVAETSVTVPGIEVVIDSGLVRRTRYHRGRGFLTLMPIALDSAEQRAGRAGRTGPGRCVRLWSEAARLSPNTPPEIHRESLLPLVLAVAACDAHVEDLSFLDPPADYAVEAAREEARALGAIDGANEVTGLGRELFGLPLDAPLGRLLVEARGGPSFDDAIDLVGALGTGRGMFPGGVPGETDCDATALIGAVRGTRLYAEAAHPAVVTQARANAKRLRRAFSRKPVDRDEEVDRDALARVAVAADPRAAHVARPRKRRVGFSHGGTEIELSRSSAAGRADKLEALVVYETRALGVDARRTHVVATCATPVTLSWLAARGLGRERVKGVKLVDGELVAEVERVFAKKVLRTERREVVGELAREAVATLVKEGRLFPEALAPTRARLRDQALAARLSAAGLLSVDVPPERGLHAHLVARLSELGFESAADLALIEADDLMAGELPREVQQALEENYPKEVRTPEARFAVELAVDEREVTLRFVAGQASKRIHPSSVPRFVGFDTVKVDTGRGLYVVRSQR